MKNYMPKYYDLSLLKPGRCYFMVSYFDDSDQYPDIETYIFAGRNLMPGDDVLEEPSWYFQEPDAYLKHGLFNAQSPTNEGIMLFEAGILEVMVNDFDSLQELLEDMKLRAS